MANFNLMNEWTFSGEIIYLKELEKDFGASLRIRGVAKREDSNYQSAVIELPCLVTKKCWEDAKKKKVAIYKNGTFSGHMEMFVKDERNSKTMFIADYVLEVA